MHDIQRRTKRVGRLIIARKAILDQESLLLAQLRKLKGEVASELSKRQGEYLQGVDRLNAIRQLADRQCQAMHEDSVTYVREQWVSLYRRVQQLERQVEAQLQVVIKAQGQVKSFEKLADKYTLAWHQYLGEKEQERIDESATFAFNRKR